MKRAAIVLEEILGSLSVSQRLTVDELAGATNLREEDVRKTLDVLA